MNAVIEQLALSNETPQSFGETAFERLAMREGRGCNG